jgi:hypothetical protein
MSSGYYRCPSCGENFTRERAERWAFKCTAKECRGRQGSFHKDGPRDGYHDGGSELWFLTASKHGIVWHSPGSLNPAARGVR